MSTYLVNGCQIETSRADVLASLHRLMQEKVSFQPVITLNVSMFSAYESDPELLEWLSEYGLFTPDGISISMLIFKYYFRIVSRYPGIDMVHDLLVESSDYRVAMIGASSNHLAKASAYFHATYPNHQLVFSLDGYSEFMDHEMQCLKEARPDLVLVALGCPKQDYFLKRLASELPSGVGIGVGGVFDVWAGAVSRAPLVLRWLGLEWLFRIILDPNRIRAWLMSLKYFVIRS